MTATIIPRPIALISTKSKNNINNIAPFSFFTIVSTAPPILLFSISDRKAGRKDTLTNIEDTKEFIINITNESMVESVNNAAANFRADINEFDEVCLTPINGKTVNCMAVKESPAYFECKLYDVIQFGNRTFLVFGLIKNIFISDEIYCNDYKIDLFKHKPLARIGGPTYAKLKDPFQVFREIDKDKLI